MSLEILHGLFVLGFSLLVVLAPFVVAAWVVLPLDRAARNRARPLQFTTLDFLGLVFIMQLPMALVHLALSRSVPQESLRLPILFAMMLAALIWWTGVHLFSRAGITDHRHRASLIFFVLPVAYFAPLVSIWLASLLFTWRWEELEFGPATAAFVAQCALYLALWRAGRISRRVVAATTPPSDSPHMQRW